ncbi:hypothetical protein CSB37_03565 [bacterium DOLZORAL124_38_8]|nr:MAG: hypothetical protein CSB37_03565 [bacterium DOLZORAL124_38_8]
MNNGLSLSFILSCRDKLKHAAFTMIELLVVIVIIGILSGMGIAQYKQMVRKAQIAKELAELKQDLTNANLSRIDLQDKHATEEEEMAQARIERDVVVKAIQVTRNILQKPVREITGHNCYACLCRGRDLSNMPDNSPCLHYWNKLRTEMEKATGIDLSLLKRDIWGIPHLIDENQGERGLNCSRDTIYIIGRDKVLEADEWMRIPLYKPLCPSG